MKLTKVLQATEDASRNFIFEGDFPGYFESRYVRRKPEYLVCYLSSQSGCNLACRFCHLTTTGQVYGEDASVECFEKQAEAVLKHYESQPSAKVIHYSWMARADAMNSRVMLETAHIVFDKLGRLADSYDLLPRFMVSTIMPKSMAGIELREIFPIIHPTIYYSIYSMNDDFRQKWLPKAMDPGTALAMLKDYQDHSGKLVRLHWAFIEGENDSVGTVRDIANAVNAYKLRVDVNIVRYNPYSEAQGREPSIDMIVELGKVLQDTLESSTKIKIVDRVGFSAKASCGMFVQDEME